MINSQEGGCDAEVVQTIFSSRILGEVYLTRFDLLLEIEIAKAENHAGGILCAVRKLL